MSKLSQEEINEDLFEEVVRLKAEVTRLKVFEEFAKTYSSSMAAEQRNAESGVATSESKRLGNSQVKTVTFENVEDYILFIGAVGNTINFLSLVEFDYQLVLTYKHLPS